MIFANRKFYQANVTETARLEVVRDPLLVQGFAVPEYRTTPQMM